MTVPNYLVDTTTYTYNYDGRIISVNSSRKELDSTETQMVGIGANYDYAYDHQGLRISNDYYISVDGELQTSQHTVYLIDQHNPTGYAQVLEEWGRPNPASAPTTLKTFTLGLDVISQAMDASPQDDTDDATVHYLMYDGHGSTRYLTDSANGSMVEDAQQQPILYNYDAYGVSLDTVGWLPENQTLTNLLYSGEMFDRNLQMYSLRARYYNPTLGRFNRLDPFIGNNNNPLTLHKYGYCHGDPVNGIDPSGLFSYSELMTSMSINAVLAQLTNIAIKPIVRSLVTLILPPAVLTGMMTNKPDALMIGINADFKIPLISTPIKGSASLEFLASMNTRKAALYFAFGISTQTQAGIGMKAGLVYQAKSSIEYRYHFVSVTFAYRYLPKEVKWKIRKDLLAELTPMTQISGLTQSWDKMKMRKWKLYRLDQGKMRLRSMLGKLDRMSVSLFFSPTKLDGAKGISFNLSLSKVTSSTPMWTIGYQFYTQLLPWDRDIPFR